MKDGFEKDLDELRSKAGSVMDKYVAEFKALSDEVLHRSSDADKKLELHRLNLEKIKDLGFSDSDIVKINVGG